MGKHSFLNVTFLIICFHIGYVTSYEEKSIYTQADLTIVYNNAPPDHEDRNEKSFTGKFGKQSPKAKASGILYYGKDETWCKPLKKLPARKEKNYWIPLIPMVTNCSIKDQIKIAQDSNVTAVIIYNNQPDKKEAVLLDDESPSMISVVIPQHIATELIEILRDHRTVTCNIAVGTHYIDRKWQVSRTSVLFVLVSFILLMCISLAWLVFYYVQRFRHIYRNDRKEKQLLSAAKKAISKLKTISFQSGTKDEEEDSCAICLECYKDGETLRVLPCKHEFHKCCIDPWLLNHRTCPMCKSNILKSLGVELPENINLSSYDSAARGLDEIMSRNVSGIEPSSIDVYQPGVSTIHAWTEASPNENLSVSSSNVSDTDSERSTAALVATVETV